MKKISIALAMFVALLCIPMVARAELRYGASAGMNVTGLKFTQPLFPVDRTVGATAGFATETMFPGIGFGVNSGIFYEMRGANLHMGDKQIWKDVGTKRCFLHYLTIPLHLRFKWTRMDGFEDYVAPFVEVGPTLGVMVGHSNNKALEYPFGDVGLAVGGGVELMRNWQLSCVYTWGVVYTAKTKLLEDFSAQNRTLDLRLTYFF